MKYPLPYRILAAFEILIIALSVVTMLLTVASFLYFLGWFIASCLLAYLGYRFIKKGQEKRKKYHAAFSGRMINSGDISTSTPSAGNK